MSVVVPMTAAPGVSADSAGASVELSATIRPVRIVVVDHKGRIVQILSNGSGNIIPTIHKNSPEGPVITMTGRIAGQYAAIMRRVDQRRTGIIYMRRDDPDPLKLFSPYKRSENI